MDPFTLGSIVSVGGGLLGGLFGGKDRWEMSPEQRQLMSYIYGQLNSGNLGYSESEKAGMLSRMNDQLQGQSQQAIASNQASLARRGMLSPGQMAGMSTSIAGDYARQYGRGVRDIELASAEAGRQSKMGLLSMLTGLSQGQFVPADNSGLMSSIGDMGQNIMSYGMLRKLFGGSQ